MASSSEKMDEDLRDATLSGDVEFLRKCVKSNKPIEYYMTYYPKNSDTADRRRGNIFHMAAHNSREDFIGEAIQILPHENTQQLLLQPREPANENPLHVAAESGNLKITKMFLDVYKSLPSDISQRPWLQKTSKGDTPCHLAIANNHEECALEILKMDMELTCNMPDDRDSNIVYDAVYNKLTKLALEILRSPYSICCTGNRGRTPFHAIQVLNSSEEAEEIFRRLLEREPRLIKRSDDKGLPVFHHWVMEGKIWPFKYLLKCHDIIPKSVFAEMVSSTNWLQGDNPLHKLVKYISSEEVAIEIAKLLIDTYKQESSKMDVPPWLVQDNCGDTPLSLAIYLQYENFAIYILSVDVNAILTIRENILFLAIEGGCHEVAEKILDIIENQGWTLLLHSYPKNGLHLAPLCKRNKKNVFNTGLLRKHDKTDVFHLAPLCKRDTKNMFHLAPYSTHDEKNLLHLAPYRKRDEKNVFHLAPYSTHDEKNVLHLAPFCKQEFVTRLVEGHPELLNEIDKGGFTILHNWVKNGEVWLFKYILESKWKSNVVKQLKETDYNKWNNPFHVAAKTNNEATNQIVKLLVEAYKDVFPECNWYDATNQTLLPWFEQNKAKDGPLHIAIRNKNQKLALYILSLYKDDDHEIGELLDYYKPEHNTLFLAIKKNCQQVAQVIMSRLDKRDWTKYLKDFSDGRNILHLATTLTNVKFGTFLVNKAPEFITEQDDKKQSPWDTTYDIGPAWFIKAVLKKDKSVFNRAPLAWIKACEKGHVSVLRAFIDHNPEAFRDLCIMYEDSPLHHMKLSSLTEYEDFLKIQHMKDLINLQNSKGETPLHKAIRNKDIFLTEALLNKKKILYTINDIKSVTAMDLLAHACKNNTKAWGLMCKRNGLDPQIQTTYLQHQTNLLDMRTSLFVVAALLATITFTAGYYQDIGEALLGTTKASLLVFLVSDTLALFFSMLVLICLTWSSMVFETSKSLILVDRSMMLLRIALNYTLLAFMTGVYVVMAPMSLWVAIVIIVITSLLIIIPIDDKNFLYDIMMNKFPAAKRECKDPLYLVELGYKTQDEMESLLSNHSEHNSNQSNTRSSRSSRKTSSESSDYEVSNDDISADEGSNDDISADEGSDDEASN